MRDAYAEYASKYRPTNGIKILFVAEAPPADPDRYFYFENVLTHDWLWIALMKGLYYQEWGITAEERLRKSWWLEKFKADGYYLIDSTKKPISGTRRQKLSTIQNNANDLLQEIRAINPESVVLIKANVYKALYEFLRDNGISVINEEALPFPAAGQQQTFHNKFEKLCLNR